MARGLAGMDSRSLREAFSLFATGVTIVTAQDAGGAKVAITANSFTSVSMDPPLILWCLANESRHIPAFDVGRRFAIHVLNERQAEVARLCARSGAPPVEVRSVPSLPPVIDHALARITCRVTECRSAGDHVIIIGLVEEVEKIEGAPLVFHASCFGAFMPAL